MSGQALLLWLVNHPNDPTNHCVENLTPLPLEFLEWGIELNETKSREWEDNRRALLQ